MLSMTNKKNKRGSRHKKPRHMIAYPSKLYEALAVLAERNRRPIQWEAHRILEEALALASLWPPPLPPTKQPPSDTGSKPGS
jgi:hypothetical protein